MRESRHQHTPVPLLLSSFPAPPSFIPPSPNPSILSSPAHPPIATPSPNPPPSLPPSSPLPPLPGKSPLSDADTLLFHSHSSPRISRASILSISTASSNRRMSSTSATSPSTRSPRDSVASNSSTSARSTRSFSASSTTPSYSSSTSSTAPPRTPSIAFSISEEAAVDEMGAIMGRRVDIVTSPESHDVLPDITAFSRSPLSKPKPLISNSLSNLKNPTSPPPSSFSLPRPPSSASKSSKSSKQRTRTRDRSNTATSTSTTMSNTSTSILPSNPSQSLLSLSSSTSLLSSSVTSLLLASDSIQDDDADDLDSILRTHSVGNESLVEGAYGGILLGDGDDGGEDSDLEFVLNHSRLGLESREGFADGGLPVEEDGGDAEALALHRSFRAKRSRSGSHRMKLNSAQGTPGQDLDTTVPPVPSLPRTPVTPNAPHTPHTPATHSDTTSRGDKPKERGRREEESGRSSSPEIGEILATTPRPSRSKSRPRVPGGSKSAPGSRRGSAANSASISRSTSIASAASMSKSLSRTSRSTGGGGVVDLDADEFGFIGAVGARMSDGEDEDGAGSDSSLDLHTPLPEDEDAPSPLTRRLSTLNMSRCPSAASMRSLGSVGSMRSVSSIGMGRVHSMGSMGSVGKGGKRHPLSRSYSSPNDGMLLERDEHDYREGNSGYDEFGYPTEGKGYDAYEGEYGHDWDDGDLNGETEVYQSFDYPRRSGESASRITTSMSLGAKARTGSGSGAANGSKVGALRMSSSLSGKGKGGLGFVNRDKGLPPLPPLSRQASSASVKSTTTPVSANPMTASLGANRIPRPLQLPRHSSMRGGNGNGGGDRSPVPVPSVPSSSPAVLTSYSQRPNTLGRSFGSGVSVASAHNGTGGAGGTGLSSSMSKSKSSVTLSTPASGESGIGKPKPRTGTGMVYRSSVTSRMRVPSAPMLGRTVGVGAAGQKTVVL
ncbi:hypothetical protein EYR40_000409 [Pleurotus pulmonarius]|nr:hypothetical protein EYR38_003658 [Pleurotus pulmonarius]KAF4608066.1 hypothetical protein EYR40_000409 [Pleurotus pulmonarius]